MDAQGEKDPGAQAQRIPITPERAREIGLELLALERERLLGWRPGESTDRSVFGGFKDEEARLAKLKQSENQPE